jgi:hypothetical protein
MVTNLLQVDFSINMRTAVSILIPIALLSSASAVSASQGQASSQTAFYASVDGQCQGETTSFVRMISPMNQCLERLNNTINSGGNLCSTTGDTPLGLSCVYDMYAMPKNNNNNPYAVAEAFSMSNCKGTTLGLFGVQTNTPINVTIDNVPGIIGKISCSPGGKIQKFKCTNTAATECTVYETVENNQCAAPPQDGTAGNLVSQSVLYRCVPSGGNMADTTSSASRDRMELAAIIMLAPILFFISSI